MHSSPPMKRRSQHPPSTLLLLRLLAICSLATVPVSAAGQLPFHPAETNRPLIRRQQDGCIANFYSCASQGAAFAGICCANGQVCRLDAANNPACCPANAVCTGVAPSSFVPPAATPAISFVPNAYFSFPYLPSSFANPGACSSAVSACGANYDSCTARLEGGAGAGAAAGGAGGVTVVAGGTTVVGAGGNAGATATLPAASATSICSSLSSVACGGLQTGMCSNAGVTTGGFIIGTGSGNAAAPRQTGCALGMMVAAAAAGVGVGLVNGF